MDPALAGQWSLSRFTSEKAEVSRWLMHVHA